MIDHVGICIECTGTYGSGLLRYLQNAGLEVLEVTAPDRMERRKWGKSDTIDTECAAHAAFSGIRTVTPKTRDGMIESLRVLNTCRCLKRYISREVYTLLRNQNRHVNSIPITS